MKVRRHRFVVDVRGTAKHRVTARIVAHKRNGKVVRERRVYRFC